MEYNWSIIKREIEFDRETKNIGKIQLVYYNVKIE